MKRQYLFLLFFLALMLPGTAHTEEEITTIDSLAVELWPHYDRASVLVLLTGALPANTKLPAAVTLPFPETAQLHAAARIDKSDGLMKDDIFTVLGPGHITFALPDLRFRLEYYLPYEVNNDQRIFDFSWLADLSVNRLEVRVQQPTFASSLTTVPTTENVFKAQDGFTYHSFPVQSVPAGQSFSVHVDYTMTTDKLSVESLAPLKTQVQKPGLPSTSKGDVGIKWPVAAVVVGGIILVFLFVWLIATYRARSSRHILRHTKGKAKSPSRFCSDCGNPIGKNDRFCSQCGSALKGNG
jgi:hypothetical protein